MFIPESWIGVVSVGRMSTDFAGNEGWLGFVGIPRIITPCRMAPSCIRCCVSSGSTARSVTGCYIDIIPWFLAKFAQFAHIFPIILQNYAKR